MWLHSFLLLFTVAGFFHRRDLPSYVYDRNYAIDDIGENHVVQTHQGPLSVRKYIGGGAYGHVFMGVLESEKRGRMRVAIKCEKPNAPMVPFIGLIPKDYSKIEHEFKMMLMMNGTTGFPDIYTANFKGRLKYYVLQLLGKSVDSIREARPDKRVEPEIALPIAIQMINRVEAIHAKGYLAYDLHLGNFLYNRGTVFLIDLGLAIPYMVNGKHVRQKGTHIPNQVKNHVLTTRHDENGEAYSRRDDVERVLMLVVYLLTGRLPWTHLHKDQIHSMKSSLSARRMCRDVPWMRGIFEHVFRLSFKAQPNYKFIRDEIEQQMT